MNQNCINFWKVAVCCFGGNFRKIIDKHLTNNFEPECILNEFNDLYNDLLNNSTTKISLFNYMKNIMLETEFKEKYLRKRIYSSFYNNQHQYRITKYGKYFTKEKQIFISEILYFPEKIFSIKSYIPLTINDFLSISGIYNETELIEFYFYSYLYKTHISYLYKNMCHVSDTFLEWFNMISIDINDIDYPIKPTSIEELTIIEKQTDYITKVSIDSLIKIYGEEYILEKIWILRLSDYIATKIINLPQIQDYIKKINELITNIYSLLKQNANNFALYSLSVVNVNDIECFNNKENDKYISPIYYDILENNRCYKLSDGYCYSVIEIYKFHNYLSPMTRQQFNGYDISTIKYVKDNFCG